MSQPIDYRDVRAFSQSSLKLLDFNVNKFYREEYLWVTGQKPYRSDSPSSDSMILGSMVDILLTRPKDFDKEYVSLVDAPTGQMKVFVENFFDMEYIQTVGYTQNLSEDLKDNLAKCAYDLAGFKRDKLETVLERFKTEGLLYYNALRKSVGKTIVSIEMMEHAKALVNQLKEDEFTGPIILEETDTQTCLTVDKEVHDQLAIYWEERGLRFKALLDKVIINHLTKTVQPYDIKTTGSSNFLDAFGSWRYDLQGAFYTDALHNWMRQEGIEGYEIKPFIFIVAFTNEKGILPQLWQMGSYEYNAGRWGVYRPKLRYLKGYSTLIDDLLWHIKEDKWKYPKEVYEKGGIRQLNYYIDGLAKY